MISSHCQVLLDDFIDVLKRKDICWDFREIRAVVMCRAWEIMEKEHVPFREAVRRAWRWAKDLCRQAGAYI